MMFWAEGNKAEIILNHNMEDARRKCAADACRRPPYPVSII
jgi:hypothetical protein